MAQEHTPSQTGRFEILYNEGSDSVVIGDTVSHDDIAEIFHNERHTVNQTVEQALETARLFVAAPAMLAALEQAQEWAAEERRWAETPDLTKWIERDEILRAAIAKATSA